MPPAAPIEGPAARVLATADRLFYEHGYTATGVNRIIDEAGVAKASFYQHYPTKETLVLACLDHRRAAWQADLESEIARHRKPNTRLLALFDFLERWLAETAFRGCAFLNLAAEFPDRDGDVRRRIRDVKAAVRERIGGLAAEAGLGEHEADTLFLLYEGATSQAQVLGNATPAAAARRVAAGMLASA